MPFEAIWCTCLKWPVTPKRLVLERNGLKFGTWGTPETRGTFHLVVFNANLGSFGALECLKMECSSKTTGLKAKRTEIWDSEILVYMGQGYIFLGLRVIWGLFACTYIKMGCNSKQLALERNGLKFGTRGAGQSQYMVYRWPCSAQGHFEVIRCICLKMVCNSKKGWLYSEWDWNFVLRHTSSTYMGYLWPCSVQGHLGVICCTCLKLACN